MTNTPGDLKVSRTPDGVAFRIHVKPRARRPGVGGTLGDALRVAVAEPPVGGRANAACTRALAERLGVRADAVELDPAARGRRKWSGSGATRRPWGRV